MKSPPSAVDTVPFPVLIADIGGTNARFAFVRDTGPGLEHVAQVQTARHADPIDAIASLGLAEGADRPRSAIMALAAPVTGDEVRLTNCPWTIRPLDLIRRLGLEQVILLNDFEAQALALPSLRRTDDHDELLPIGGGEPVPEAGMVVIGPGTGLGVASLVRAVGRWIPIPGEGGHVSLGPESDDELPIWAHLERIGGRVTAETVLSGSGMLRLARAVSAACGVACPFPAPEAITAAADAGDDLARSVLRLFARCLGRVAGDFALVSLARGGVYIAGGIPQKIERYLTDGTFRAAFEAKAPHSALVTRMPTYLVRHPQAALVGLAAFARCPTDYGLELDGRVWRR